MLGSMDIVTIYMYVSLFIAYFFYSLVYYTVLYYYIYVGY